MKKSHRWGIIGLIILLVASGLAFGFAPAGNSLQRGSTYSRAPAGYGAWYAFMQAQGNPVERWQKPPAQLNQLDTQITLLRVGSGLSPAGHGGIDTGWLASGNVLIELGIEAPVTAAPFTTIQPTGVGEVKIQTRRRFPLTNRDAQPTPMLQDAYGVIVRQTQVGKGERIEVNTPHLAANAYQAAAGNFHYLKSLVTQPGLPIYVDEFMHGYKDKETRQQEGNRSWLDYLARTPWRAVLLQGVIVLAVLLWGLNWRLGAPRSWRFPELDQSRVYMDALASVLMRAGCTEVVIELLAPAEQRYLQRQLGLGDELLGLEPLAAIWEHTTGQKAPELIGILGLPPQRLNDRQLVAWLEKLQQLRGKVPAAPGQANGTVPSHPRNG